jgi:hypothetical protein
MNKINKLVITFLFAVLVFWCSVASAQSVSTAGWVTYGSNIAHFTAKFPTAPEVTLFESAILVASSSSLGYFSMVYFSVFEDEGDVRGPMTTSKIFKTFQCEDLDYRLIKRVRESIGYVQVVRCLYRSPTDFIVKQVSLSGKRIFIQEIHVPLGKTAFDLVKTFQENAHTFRPSDLHLFPVDDNPEIIK